jgi:hypothetical protein
MGLTHDRAKIFKIMNNQMYENEPFKLEVNEKPKTFILSQEELNNPKYQQDVKSKKFNKNHAPHNFYKNYKERLYM